MEDASPFEYAPLNLAKPEIRLLKILPIQHSSPPSSKENTLSCQLITLPLDFDPKYVALSYAWGDTTRTQPIFLNSSIIYITVNLEIALRTLRSTSSPASLFWIDALCINQNDDTEKSAEVQRMLSIYRGAEMVLVWLGPPTPSSIVAMNKLDQFVDFFIRSSKSLEEAAEEFVQIRDDVEGFDGISPIQSLVERPWFRRVWIVQEIAAAKRVHFLCGTQTAPSELLPLIVTAIDSTILKKMRELFDQGLGWNSNTGTMMVSPYDLEWRAPRFFRSVESLSLKEDSRLLWKLLLTFKSYNGLASDPRDYIFALLGLAQDTALGLSPDYSLPISTCYTQVAKAFLKQGQLRLLWLCAQPKSIPDLPSWVPDWSTNWRI